MPALTASSCLEANLAALGERNADVARRIRAAAREASLVLHPSEQGVPAATWQGRPLCSRRKPLEEAARLVNNIDLVENAAVVVTGFGLGYHAQQIAERMKKAGVLIIFEPDHQLLRAVFEHIDHSHWLRNSITIWFDDPDDRAALVEKLGGSESIVLQGIAFVHHPPSRERLAGIAATFSKTLSDYITTAKVSLMTTLMRSADTVKNYLLNFDHYAFGEGVRELANLANGCPAVVVSAGPSLKKNMHLLAQPGVRDRCVIVAVQTTLKPLLDAGIKPHFITALDYHEISRRFYEGIDPDQVRDVTLIADPKVHPSVIRAWPGPLRCCAAPWLDQILGPCASEKGLLPAGATVAHLALYVASHLGCNPIALIGQDLGFPDGLYYAPGTAIHNEWAPELNPFNTIAMMEWQRIARMRVHLHKIADIHGRSIYTDTQMLTYLQHFERDFARYRNEGRTIIDATEGGARKQHVSTMTLRRFLEEHARNSLPPLPIPPIRPLRIAAPQVARQVRSLRDDVESIGETSRSTSKLLARMIQHQHDQNAMQRHFKQLDKHRHEVEQRFNAFEILNHLNQMGVFRRQRADRRLHMQDQLDPMARQRAQLERDHDNVQWLIDAADALVAQLDEVANAVELNRPIALSGEALMPPPDPAQSPPAPRRVAAIIPIHPTLNGLLLPRSLSVSINGINILQTTLLRLAESETIDSIILLCPDAFNVDALLNRNDIGKPLHIERCGESPYPPEHVAFAKARLWSTSCWRGGIAGTGVYDELLCPQLMHRVMIEHQLDAALLVGPDWPLVNIRGPGGCDAVVRRYLDKPDTQNITFTQAPPGLCGCVVTTRIMRELAQRNRLSTIGGLLTYQPHAPQPDPIALPPNVQIDAAIRHSLDCFTHPSTGHARLPSHLQLELNTTWRSTGHFHRHPFGTITRPPIELALAKSIFQQLAHDNPCAVLTLVGLGDPLLHDHFHAIVRSAKDLGIAAIHIRTALDVDPPQLDQLLDCGVDVISVELHADTPATYRTMMGSDRHSRILHNIEYLLERRTVLTHNGTPAARVGLPWIVPRLQRCQPTIDEIDSFFDRWMLALGTPVIESPPPFQASADFQPDPLTPAVTPTHVTWKQLCSRMTICSDGSIPASELDLMASNTIGNAKHEPLATLWQRLLTSRHDLRAECGDTCAQLQLVRP